MQDDIPAERIIPVRKSHTLQVISVDFHYSILYLARAGTISSDYHFHRIFSFGSVRLVPFIDELKKKLPFAIHPETQVLEVEVGFIAIFVRQAGDAAIAGYGFAIYGYILRIWIVFKAPFRMVIEVGLLAQCIVIDRRDNKLVDVGIKIQAVGIIVFLAFLFHIPLVHEVETVLHSRLQ